MNKICNTIPKLLLVVFNGIFLVCGIVILAIGIWVKQDPQFSNLGHAVKIGTAEPIVEIVTWTFIGVGIFVFAIAFAGLIGTIRESKIIMGFYIVCIFIVFLAEVSAGAYAGIRKDYLIQKLEEDAAEHLRLHYAADDEELLTKGMNYVQQTWKCCGIRNFMDYKNSTFLKVTGNKIKSNATMSWSCCRTTTQVADALSDNGNLMVSAEDRETCMTHSIEATGMYNDISKNGKETPDAEKLEEIYETCGNTDTLNENNVFHCRGCSSELKDWAAEHMVILLGVGVGIGVLQLVLMFLALWFCSSMGQQKEKQPEPEDE